ncbi:NUDIX hydrolase [Glutamicibacter sp. NPDC087344]|uniref:NUDIX hydrolase n=1 Tax=Glutamicibacter sp. NPDC087344 TaxID=3363994 RepID=UPI00382B8312
MTTKSSFDPASNVPIRRAASVLLVREADTGFEVFIQHRVSTMDFAAGMVVYPGGRVDAQDADLVRSGAFDDQLLAALAQRWSHASVWDDGVEQAAFHAGEMLAAARREVFEETGLLLEPNQLQPWANWVTPAGYPKRFDTYFFVAVLAPGQEPRHQTTEAAVSNWIHPEALFAALHRGEIKMMRPTQRTLLDAMELGGIEALKNINREIIPVHPTGMDVGSASPVSKAELRPRND